MESFLGVRPVGEESLQMWDLNKRLEAYLARVKFLEEENELLKAEIQGLKVSPVESSWRGRCEEELAALRATLDEAFREKSAAELTRDNLYEEVQQVKGRCRKERAAQEEAKKLLSVSKKELEEEKRAHLWLRERAGQLEKELQELVEAHQVERAGLDQEVASFSWSLESFQAAPAASLPPVEVEDYSKRLSSIWKGAVETYKTEVSQLEASLGEAKENLWKATQGSQQNLLQLQQLKKELAGLKIRKEVLEESLAQQWQHQQGEAETLQLAIVSLEEEKRSLRVRIAQVLEDRQQLMHLKMSLSLEVATYRTLLEAESARLQMPAVDYKLANGLRDAKLEVSSSGKLQAPSLDRGHLGPRDLRPSPATFLKGTLKPRFPKNQNDPFVASLASVLPKSRSPVAREFQRANTALQSQAAKGFEGASPQKEARPAFADAAAFKLGSSAQSKVIVAANAEMVSQPFLHERPPTFGSISPPTVPDVLEECSSSAAQRLQQEGDEEPFTQMEAEGTEGKEGLSQGEEEEGLASKEPPGKTTLQATPYPSQLVTEALETALKEVNGGGPCFESQLLHVPKAQNGAPSDDLLSTEEDDGAASSGESEGGIYKLHKEQGQERPLADVPGDVKGSEVEANGGGQEVCAEQSGGEREVWVPQEVEAASLQETELLKEERSPSGLQNGEEPAAGVPVTGGMESGKETGFSEEEGAGRQPPTLQSAGLCEEAEEVSEGAESASPLGKEAPAFLEEEVDVGQPGTSRPDERPGAMGGDLEEADGGTEDLEVVSTEALHLSEDEERRELWSPSRENEEECDFQAEMLESEILQVEGLTLGHAPPTSPPALPAESCQEHLLFGGQQQKLEEAQVPLDEADSAMPEEEGEVVATEAVASRVIVEPEEATLGDEHSVGDTEGIILAEEGMGAEEEEQAGRLQEGIWGHEDLCKEEDALENEGAVEKEGALDEEAGSSEDGPCGPDATLQQEDVLGQETSTREQLEGPGEASQGQLHTELKAEEGEAMDAPPEMGGDTLKGEDLITGTEAAEVEHEKEMGILGVEEMVDHVSADNLQDKENPPQPEEASLELGRNAQQVEEEQIAAEAEGDETFLSQHTTPLEQSTVHNTSEALEGPLEVQSDVTGGPEPEAQADMSATFYCPLQSDYSASEEDSLESLETSPNASCETDGIEKELESSKQIFLEETLPDHTPLHMYEGEMLAVTGKGQTPPENEEAAEVPLLTKGEATSLVDTGDLVEEEGSHSPPAAENDTEQAAGATTKAFDAAEEHRDGSVEPVLSQDSEPATEESPAPKDIEESEPEAPELIGDGADLHTTQPEVPGEGQSFAQLDAESEEPFLKPERAEDKGPELGELLPEEEAGGTDAVWEPAKDSVFEAGLLGPSDIQEGVCVDSDGPPEFSDLSDQEAEGAHKISPLTSVADLGEIVLEGESSPNGEASRAEPQSLSFDEDESLACALKAQQIAELGSCGEEDTVQQRDPAEEEPRGEEAPDPSSENTVVSIPTDSIKASDILEIVEQALEFNQELMKAAEQGTETEQLAAGGDKHPPQEGESNCTSATVSDAGETQLVTGTLEASSPTAKDPTTSSRPWVEGHTNGLQPDPSLTDFTKEILNGLGDLPPGNEAYEIGTSGEEFIKKVAITQQFRGEEIDGLSTLAKVSQDEETPRTGEGDSEPHEKVLLDQEAPDADESLFADILQTACVKGKGAELEAISVPPHFCDEVLHLEPSPQLKFRPEEDEELWSSEDN